MQGDYAAKYENSDPSDLVGLDLPFNVHEVDPRCLKCVRRQLAKYNSYLDSKKKSLKDRFIIQCHGIPKNPINQKLKHVLSFEEYEEAERSLDPIKWAKHYLCHPDYTPWEARHYQEDVMRCTSTRRALRISRRTGKCVSGQAMILTDTGPIRAEELYKEAKTFQAVSLSEHSGDLKYSHAEIFENGEKPVFLLKTKNGRETTVTGNHPFLVLKEPGVAEWVELSDLQIGDKIAAPIDYSQLDFKSKYNNGERKSRLLGYLAGDGGTSYKITVRFSNQDKEILDDLSDILTDYGCELNNIGGIDYNIVGNEENYRKKGCNAVNALVDHEHLRSLAIQKQVPESILCGTKEDIAAFLGAYWDCDGWASINKKCYNGRKYPNVEVGIGTSSPKMALQVKHLLLRLGIFSSLRKRKVKYQEGHRWSWQVTMSGKHSIGRFREQIKLRAKQENLDKVWDIVSLRQARNTEDQYFWDVVSEVTELEAEQTYDVSVPEHHNFIVDDIITHNTDMVSVEIVWKLFTNKDRRIVVAAPQKVHVEEIFKRVRGFIYRNPALANSIVKDVSSPVYELRLQNGSYVMGFALGTRGKTEGLSVRGQNADDVYCVPKGSLVNTSEFGLRPIESLTLEDTVLGGDKNGIQVGSIKNIGVRQDTLITIPTALSVLKCTPNHPLFDGEKDIPAKDATETISSLYYRKLTFGRDVITARLLGYLYGDGWISKGTVGFSGGRMDLEQIQEDLRYLGIPKTTIHTRETENKDLGIKGTTSQFSTTYAYPLFKDSCPEGKKVYQPLRVPSKIKLGTEYIKTAFLSGLFSAEGEGVKYQTNNKTPRVIRLNMRSSKENWIVNWMEDLSLLLHSVNIKHNVSVEHTTNKSDNEDRFVGIITILNSKENIQRFVDKIGYCYSADKTVSANIYKLFRKYEKTWSSESWRHNRKIRSLDAPASVVAFHVPLTLSGIEYHKNLYHELYSEPLLTPAEYVDSIRWKDNYVKLPIRKEGVRIATEPVDVYNLTSTASNRFLVSSMITHNCDEMDYVDEKAVQGGLLPVLQTTDHTSMTGFSTPTGFKSVYYSFCEEMPEFREFHYNYKVLPHWKQVEADRGAYTQEEWIHEMLAEWGSSEEGVYKPSYVDRALKSYSYEEMGVPMPSWRYIIGVDWNEKHGAEICITGENPSGYYQVVNAFCVEKSEYTQLSSVNAVIEANRKWKPSFIFVDAGNGSTNYEMLRKLSWDQRRKHGDPDTARIIDILRKYDSGSSIQTKDPITGEPRKAPAKSYMVNASVRAFENNKVRISSADKDLEKQFRNYIIERISPTGNPVYGMRDRKVKDHRLDAFNLSMVGFYLEFGGLQPQMAITSMAATVNPITKKLGSPRTQNPEPVTANRGLDSQQDRSVLGHYYGASMPARVNRVHEIHHTNPGWATDEESKYEQMHSHQRRGRRNLRNGNPINRSNI